MFPPSLQEAPEIAVLVFLCIIGIATTLIGILTIRKAVNAKVRNASFIPTIGGIIVVFFCCYRFIHLFHF